MKLKRLESIVQDVEPFASPKIELEQYATTPHLASRMVFTAHGLGDIEGRRVLDLGCGCAMLAICAEVMGSGCTTGFDIDADALQIAEANCERIGADVDFVLQDVRSLPSLRATNTELHSPHGRSAKEAHRVPMSNGLEPRQLAPRPYPPFDTVLMNPPFGTRCNGIDTRFVEAGLALGATAVYSLHKSSTREHFVRKARQWGVRCTVLAELRFNLDSSYAFHRQATKDVAVDLIRFSRDEPIPIVPLPCGPSHALQIDAAGEDVGTKINAKGSAEAVPAAQADGACSSSTAVDVQHLPAPPSETAPVHDEDGRYECEFDCGFYGDFDSVCAHEALCKFRSGAVDEDRDGEADGGGDEDGHGTASVSVSASVSGTPHVAGTK